MLAEAAQAQTAFQKGEVAMRTDRQSTRSGMAALLASGAAAGALVAALATPASAQTIATATTQSAG